MGNLAFAIPFQFITGFFYFYSTSVLKINPGLIGFIVSLSVIWDAVTDPVMGYISDCTALKKFGRRHLYLIVGAAGTAVSNYLLWTIQPFYNIWLKLLLTTAYLFLCKTFLTIYGTPYNALGAELSTDYNERTSIQAFKTTFFIIGFLFPTIAGMAIFFKGTTEYPVGQLNPAAYNNLGIFSSLVTLLFAGICYAATRKSIPLLPKPPHEKGSVKGLYADMFAALKNPNFRSIVIGYLFINFTSALLSGIGLHVMTYTYRLDNYKMAFIFGGLFAVAVISQPIWTFLAAKKDKKKAVLLAILLGLIGSAGFLPTVFLRFNPDLNLVILMAVAIVLGFSTGGCLSIPYSMLADTIDQYELKTGERKEGVYYGTITFMYKFTQAIIVFILGIVLTAIGFNAELKEQPHFVAVCIGLILPLGALLAFSLAYVFFKKYELSRGKVEEIQKLIRLKKEGLK